MRGRPDRAMWVRLAAIGAFVNFVPAWMAAKSPAMIVPALAYAAVGGAVILLVLRRRRA